MIRRALLVFDRDFRCDDQPMLHFAADNEMESIGVVFVGDIHQGDWPVGVASKAWLYHSLKSFQKNLKKMGVDLILSPETADTAIDSLFDSYAITDLLISRNYEAAGGRRIERLERRAIERGLGFHSFNSRFLWEPWDIKTRDKKPYRVFTAYWKESKRLDEVSRPRPAPKSLRGLKRKRKHNRCVDSLGLWPSPSSRDFFIDPGSPGEGRALERVRDFQKRVGDYGKTRDLPALAGTSRLSAHLHFGELSPRRLWHEILETQEGAGRETFLKQLGWREFAGQLLYHFPQMDHQPLRESFEKFPWTKNRRNLESWQKGLTGYPIVDAGMRELWHTGAMHNRLRMIVGSFLVKDLRIHWLEGARWFWETLVDADWAQNSLGWQWISGCGADAAPYFRVFNPVLQSKKFDPAGEYIRRWVPELSRLSDSEIHAPWELSAARLRSVGVKLGGNYPRPIIDHRRAREKALQAFKSLR